MGAFGDKLRREREMRGVTIAEMSESTKISKRWLQALEDEEFVVLPGGVFNRGFVRSYARFLGINEDQAVADYVAASKEQPPPEDKFPLEIHEKEGSPPLNPKRSFLPVALAIVALVLVGGGWTWWVKHKPQTDAHAIRTPEPTIASQPAPPAQAQPVTEGTSAPASEKSVPSSAGGASSSTNEDGTAKPDKDAAEADTGSEHASVDPNKNLNKSFTVSIKAKESSWISIVADGKTRWEGMLDPNMERSVKAGKELVLKTGNAAGLDISYNGRPLGALGKANQVRTLTFNTAGLQQ